MTYENFETTLEQPIQTGYYLYNENFKLPLVILYSEIAPGVKGLLIRNGFLPKCCHFQNSVIASGLACSETAQGNWHDQGPSSRPYTSAFSL